MIEWFLMLFPSHAALRLMVSTLQLERESLMRECDSARARVEDLQKVADVMAWRVTGRRIFSTDTPEPEMERSTVTLPQRMMGRDLVRKQLDEFNAQMRKHAEAVSEPAN